MQSLVLEQNTWITGNIFLDPRHILNNMLSVFSYFMSTQNGIENI